MRVRVQAASACLVDALLKAHGGDNSLLLAQLQEAQGVAAGNPSQVSTQACLSAPTALSSALSEGRAIWSSGPEQLHMKVLQMVPARQSGSLPA